MIREPGHLNASQPRHSDRKSTHMDTTAAPPIAPIRLPVQVWLGTLASALLLFVMLQDNGVLLHNTLLNAHEFFHDGRHLLGVPCH